MIHAGISTGGLSRCVAECYLVLLAACGGAGGFPSFAFFTSISSLLLNDGIHRYFIFRVECVPVVRRFIIVVIIVPDRINLLERMNPNLLLGQEFKVF